MHVVWCACDDAAHVPYVVSRKRTRRFNQRVIITALEVVRRKYVLHTLLPQGRNLVYDEQNQEGYKSDDRTDTILTEV